MMLLGLNSGKLLLNSLPTENNKLVKNPIEIAYSWIKKMAERYL